MHTVISVHANSASRRNSEPTQHAHTHEWSTSQNTHAQTKTKTYTSQAGGGGVGTPYTAGRDGKRENKSAGRKQVHQGGGGGGGGAGPYTGPHSSDILLKIV